MSATPDTGCTRTIINSRVARKHGLKYKPGEKISLVAANGERMKVDGTIKVKIEGNGTEANVNALVSEAVQDDMLLSCQDLITLKAIPIGFPNSVVESCKQVKFEPYRTTLLEEFTDVLSDELNPKPMKTAAPMKISIKRGANPRKVTSARRVPLRYEKEARKTVKELIKKGVITPVSETTDWCSPAFFVPKADKIRVRLVTDYTELNRHVKRPIHPFTPTQRRSCKQYRMEPNSLPN